jgi:secreted protein with Ig-like and vWFA domain/anti-sigma factor RsiW
MKEIFQDDPRLTAYALGELEGEEFARVEAAVRRDPALRSAVDDIRATARSIESALAAEAAGERPTVEGGSQTAENGGWQSDPVGSSAAIYPAGEKTGQRGELLRFPSLYFVIGSLAAACFAVMVALHEPPVHKFAEKKTYVEVSLPPPAAAGVEQPTGGTAGAPADAAASIKFDARLEKPEAAILASPVGRVAEDASGSTWTGGAVGPNKAAVRTGRQSSGDQTITTNGRMPAKAVNASLTLAASAEQLVQGQASGQLNYSASLGDVDNFEPAPPSVEPRLPANNDLNKAAPRRRFNNRIDGPAGMSFAQSAASLAPGSGGPATAFGFDAFGSRSRAPNLAFGDLGGRTFGATGGLANGVAGALPVGPFSGARSALPADRYDWRSAPQATSQYYYYPPDEKFVFRAVPYGSNPLDDKSVYRAVPYGSMDLLARPMPLPRIRPGALVVRPEPFNTEDYAQIRDNDFAAVAVEPLSTFSLDVDTASYTNLRRFLEHGERPPRDAVRIAELVNYFPYRYAPPASGDVPFAASLEVAAAPWNPQHRLVRIGLKARETSDAARPAANLVFLVDVSGSMAAPAKLPLVQESLRLLVGRLRADDHVAIVTYATQATLALPATPVAHAADILAAVDGLTARGSTNGAMGLQLAYDVAKANVVVGGVNRVILCTDGDFNVGVTGRGDLVRLIEDKAKSGVFLTVLGFGMGNLKDATLEQLANHGNGIYGYVDSAAEAKRLLVEQAGATLVTVAKDVKVQVEFNPAVAGAYRLIGYENRLLRKQDFTDDRIDAGEVGAGHTVTALYEIVPVGATAALRLADTEPLKYWRTEGGGRRADSGAQKSGNSKPGTRNPELDSQNPEPGTMSSELLTVKIRYKEPDGSVSQRLEFPLTDRGTTWVDASDDFKFAASVASFGMILRESPYKGTATLAAVAEWARQGLGSDVGGQRNEFLGLVSRAQTIVQ